MSLNQSKWAQMTINKDIHWSTASGGVKYLICHMTTKPHD